MGNSQSSSSTTEKVDQNHYSVTEKTPKHEVARDSVNISKDAGWRLSTDLKGCSYVYLGIGRQSYECVVA